MTQVLFTGRLHITTKFQQKELAALKGVSPKKFRIKITEPFDTIVVVVTSADHKGTKRNPLAIERRVEALIPFLEAIGMNYKIVSIPDIPDDKKWVDFVEKQIEYQSQESVSINPRNTVLFSSTPSVMNLFKKKNYKIIRAEINPDGTYKTLRPFEVIDLLVNASRKWKAKNAKWKKYASNASINLYKKYNLGEVIQEIYSEVLTTSEGELTETRNFRTYGSQMDASMPMKWQEISPFIVEGKIVDAGCGTGTLLFYLSENFPEADVIGIDLSREFLRYCEGQYYPNHNVYVYRKNIISQNFRQDTIATKIFSSILHEVYSYNNYSKQVIAKTLRNTYKELEGGGRVIIRDGVKPENKTVYLLFNSKDGVLNAREVHKLSSEGRFLRFAKDFKKGGGIKYSIKYINGIKYYKTSLQDAYEFMNKKDYPDNWDVEVDEVYGVMTFREYCNLLNKIGYKIVNGSREILNPWIKKNRLEGKISIFEMKNKKLIPIEYPPTHMILVGEKQHIK